MINRKIFQYRKGVSPVIAVVLLIALTVASVAVIWSTLQGIDPTTKTLYVDVQNASLVNSTDLQVILRLDASDQMTITGLVFVQTPGNIDISSMQFDSASSVQIDSGSANIITVSLKAQAGSWTNGEYEFQLYWQSSGDDRESSPGSFSLFT